MDMYRAVVEQAVDAMIVADRDGIIRLWNRASEALFGHAAAEAVGASLDLVIPERLREAHWNGYRRAIESGVIRNAGRVLTTRSMRKDGSRLYVDLSFALLKDEGGAVTGSLAVGRDCTQRYEADRALRERVAALEKRLGEA
jgi:PAS domain S-box-containing protein